MPTCLGQAGSALGRELLVLPANPKAQQTKETAHFRLPRSVHIIGVDSSRLSLKTSCRLTDTFAIPTMIDSERFKLVYGPYLVPKCALGDKLPCEYRGQEVTVKGMSDAPIQWPCTRRNRNASPILCGDLIRAVRTESEQAVAYHWGVNLNVVWRWRRALNVGRMTNGSRRLRIEYAVETLTPEVRAKGREAMHSPAVRAKLRRSERGGLSTRTQSPPAAKWGKGQSPRNGSEARLSGQG